MRFRKYKYNDGVGNTDWVVYILSQKNFGITAFMIGCI